MKISDLAILFVLITLPFALILRIKSDNLQNTEYRTILYNRYIDTAVEDASAAMIINGSGRNITVSKEKAINAFMNTLFANFKALGKTEQDILMSHVPVVILVNYDGYYVYSMNEYINADNEKEQKMAWKPIKPYTYESKGFVYLFTLDDYVKVYDTKNNKFFEGAANELKHIVSAPLLQDYVKFETIRKNVIIEAIKSDVNNAINHHNTYAAKFGISYRFSPPSISNDDWQRNIEDVGFLAFFQGLPIGLGGERFNTFALGGARIVRNQHYYIQQDPNGLFYYHREQCTSLTEKDKIYDSREECALKGAFPCHLCCP